MDRSHCNKDAVDALTAIYESGNLGTGFVSTSYSVGTAPVGAKNGSTVSVKEYGFGNFRTTVLTCTATPLVLTDEPNTVVYGGVKLYDFPLGMICTMGAVVGGTLTTVGTAATWEGDVALGTATATTGATLVSTEADIMPSVAIDAATAKVGTVKAVSVATALTESGARWLDGTTTAKDLYLNFVVDENAANATSTGAFTGTVTINWIFLGDH